MPKCLSIGAAVFALFALLVTCAQSACAGEIVTDETFVSGTSFEYFGEGWFNPVQSDEGNEYGPYHWASAEIPLGCTNYVDQIVAYRAGEAYDYEAKGQTRSKYLAESEPGNDRYLVVDAEAALHRGIFANPTYSPTNLFTNVAVRVGSRESIYCDLLTKFTPAEECCTEFSDARLIVWARVRVTDEIDGLEETNLMVTAGFFTNDFRQTVWREFRLDTTEICTNGFDLSRWYRLTVRNHGDVSANGNTGLAGFSVYLDGQPIRAVAEDYAIWDNATARPSWLSPEARTLWRERRLFPNLAAFGTDAALTMSGIAFFGSGSVDDVTISSSGSDSVPDYARPDTVFTLNWDGGVTALEYTLDGGLTTNAVSVEAQTADILLGAAATNGLVLKVTKCVYNEARGFKPGVWFGSNGATLTNETEFVFDGTTRNPIATIASTRETIDIGPGGFDLFVSAIAALDRSTNAVKTLRLMTNVVVSKEMVKSTHACDYGAVRFTNMAGEYELDLNGHTLRGQALTSAKSGAQRLPTVAVSCKSLRIYDSSSPDPVTKLKSGRVLPIGSYTNAEELLNTAVAVYPGMAGGAYVEPVLTVQDGIYDGWVRNPVKFYTNRNDVVDGSLVGAIIVEGGRFISTNATTFYLESSVTNPALSYAYSRGGYWAARSDTNLVIWTGLGDGRRWTDGNNWRIGRPPNATETALFPIRDEGLDPWTVDLEDGRMSTKSFVLEYDVSLSGSNDFVGVTLSSDSTGRFTGDAILLFDNNNQPGLLTETQLRDDWAGTVIVRNLGLDSPKTLKSMETWGTAHSTVVFNGVRGYVMDRVSHTMPYDFVLRDLITTVSGKVTTNCAWKNESGYTGSTLAFTGKLLGDGTFQSGANAKAIYQTIKFADVVNYTGRFDVKGKRVLVGNDCELASYAGLIAFGNPAYARTDLGWTCRYATFSDTLYLMGQTNGVLVTATSEEPDVSACGTLYLKCSSEGSYVPDVAWLASTNDPKYAVYVSDVPRPESVSDAAPSPATVSASLFSTAGASSYSMAALQAVGREVAQSAVDNANVSLVVDEDVVYVVITGTTKGLWYGVKTRSSLAADWSEPTEWNRATGSSVTLDCAKQGNGEACFYCVVVSYENPE